MRMRRFFLDGASEREEGDGEDDASATLLKRQSKTRAQRKHCQEPSPNCRSCKEWLCGEDKLQEHCRSLHRHLSEGAVHDVKK